jgi:MFS family permease
MAPAGKAAVPRLAAAVLVCFLAGPMLSMIDSSVVNVAVPVIVAGLHTTLGTAAWAVSGYLLGLACGLAATPWLARRYGTLPAYGAALLAFTLASAACALVPGVGLLIAARVVQGLAGAPMVPLAMSMILDPARAGDRNRGMPASAGVVLFAAPALGPAVGGLLVSACAPAPVAPGLTFQGCCPKGSSWAWRAGWAAWRSSVARHVRH